jgi:GNAT superfamily N-acetyltransferase
MNPQDEIASTVRLATREVYVIREASLNDISTIVEQRRQMYLDMGYTDPAKFHALENEFAHWLVDRFGDGRYHNWFAVHENGDIAAGAGLWLVEWPPQMMDVGSPFRGYVMNVYTNPAYRKRGLAKQLVATIVNWCAAHDIHTISMHASPEGRPIYEALGFGSTNELRICV